MLNSLPDIVHNISQDNDNKDKHASYLLKRRIHYLIHDVKLDKAAKLQRDKKSQEKALLQSRSLPGKVADARAAAIKAVAKNEKRKQYYLLHKVTINYKSRLQRA